jgi:hypothetical protein
MYIPVHAAPDLAISSALATFCLSIIGSPPQAPPHSCLAVLLCECQPGYLLNPTRRQKPLHLACRDIK